MFFDFHGQLVERQVGNQQMLGANPETALKIRDDKAFIEIEEAPAVADLQSQITHYEDGGRGQIDPSLSQQVDLVADASKALREACLQNHFLNWKLAMNQRKGDAHVDRGG